MKRQILIPLDSSSVGRDVIHLADQWGQMFEAELIFLQVNPVQRGESDQTLLESVLAAEKITAPYQAYAAYGNPAQEILELERRLNPWLIMMAAHSHSVMARILLGSNTDYVVNLSKTSVLVYKRSLEALKDVILVPVDYSEVNTKTIAWADELAQKMGLSLMFLHVYSLPEFAHYNMEHGWQWDQMEIERFRQEEERRLEGYLTARGIKSPYQFELGLGKPYEQIMLRQQHLNARLIVMASHQHSLMERVLLGSNTKYLLHQANCPLLVYKDAE
ncbi:MAG: universal stress protein [bacterium]|nr:universal stress protein [bacterium]